MVYTYVDVDRIMNCVEFPFCTNLNLRQFIACIDLCWNVELFADLKNILWAHFGSNILHRRDMDRRHQSTDIPFDILKGFDWIDI